MVATKAIPRTLARNATNHLNQRIRLQGWVHVVRAHGNVSFIVLRDRSGMLQTVLGRRLEHPLAAESVVEMIGTVVPEPRAPQGVELHVEELCVIQSPQGAPPLELNKPLDALGVRLDTLLDHRVLSLRHPEIHPVFELQSEVIWAFREFLRGEGFTEIHTPKLIATGTEGGTALFPVQYFERTVYLAQSPQFYKQMLVGAGYERVYEVGPVFRAESHNTSRHLNEYTSLDVELGFIAGLDDLLELETRLLRYVADHVTRHCAAAFETLGVKPPAVPKRIPRYRLAEAALALNQAYGKTVDGDLDTEAERLLCELAFKEHGSELAFVTHYPREVRPMYAQPDPDDPVLTASFDLLYRGLEITTGGQRIHDPALLESSIRARGLDPTAFEFYLETFRYGMPPHGGFAIGAERLTMLMLGLTNVRQATLFPRDRTRIAP